MHLILASWLMRSTGPSIDTAAEVRMTLRWLTRQPEPVTSEPLITAATTDTPPAHRRNSTPLSMAAVATPLPVTPAAATTEPLDLRLPAGMVGGGDGIDAQDFAPRLLGGRESHPAFAPRKYRFRMKPQTSPEQMIQSFARSLGLWPSGYIIDPCALARQDAEYFSAAVDARDRQALRDALHKVSARCR